MDLREANRIIETAQSVLKAVEILGGPEQARAYPEMLSQARITAAQMFAAERPGWGFQVLGLLDAIEVLGVSEHNIWEREDAEKAHCDPQAECDGPGCMHHMVGLGGADDPFMVEAVAALRYPVTELGTFGDPGEPIMASGPRFVVWGVSWRWVAFAAFLGTAAGFVGGLLYF